MSEPIKIEPYYQAHAKELVDHLFDKGYFSDTLSRDGMDGVEGLLALYLQLDAQSAARCAELSKKFKATKGRQDGEDQPRHEEEMRWIARAREAEARVAELEKVLVREEKANAAWKWGLDVGAFLKKTITPHLGELKMYTFDMTEASRLFTEAIALGITPAPDCRPKKIIVASPGSEASHLYPGAIVFTDSRGKELCNHIHDPGGGETGCTLPKGHTGPHKNGRQEWG